MQGISTHNLRVQSNAASPCEGDAVVSTICSITSIEIEPISRSSHHIARTVEVEEYDSSPDEIASSGETVPSNTTPNVGILVASALALIGIALVKSTSWKHVWDSVHLIKYSRQIPCSKCRFFNQNPYMRCAVHPTKAQTSRAINCSDYWGYDNDGFRH